GHRIMKTGTPDLRVPREVKAIDRVTGEQIAAEPWRCVASGLEQNALFHPRNRFRGSFDQISTLEDRSDHAATQGPPIIDAEVHSARSHVGGVDLLGGKRLDGANWIVLIT